MKYAVCPHCNLTAPIPAPSGGPTEKQYGYTTTVALGALNLLDAVFGALPASIVFEYMPEGTIDEFARIRQMANGKDL